MGSMNFSRFLQKCIYENWKKIHITVTFDNRTHINRHLYDHKSLEDHLYSYVHNRDSLLQRD
jgi:hypothetical protein